MSNRAIREVVAVFDPAEAPEQAVFDLKINGFDRASFSILASEHTVEAKLGQRYRRVEEKGDEPGAPRETFFARASQLEAEFGLAPAFALLAAVGVGLGTGPITLPVLVAAGSGAVLGAFLGRLIHRHQSERLNENLIGAASFSGWTSAIESKRARPRRSSKSMARGMSTPTI